MNSSRGPVPCTGVVLLVEADHAVGDVLQRRLTAAGIRTERAGTGQQAIAYRDRAQPALLLLDLNLPDCYGEAVGVAARQRYGNAVPIIAIASTVRRNPCLPPLRAAAFLAAPFTVPELLRTVTRFIAVPTAPEVQVAAS